MRVLLYTHADVPLLVRDVLLTAIRKYQLSRMSEEK